MRIPNVENNVKPKESDMDALMDSLNDPSHKRSVSETIPESSRKALDENKSQEATSSEPSEAVHPEKQQWGDSENGVGLRISTSADPSSHMSTPFTTHSKNESEPDVNSLTEHIENLECDLDVALGQIDQKNRDIESKQIRIDILENKLKQLQIDYTRDRQKDENLLNEKDAAIMKLQSEKEGLKAEIYKLQLERNEEKEKNMKGTELAEHEASEIQRQLKRIEDENDRLKREKLEEQEKWRKQEEVLKKSVVDQQNRIQELSTELDATQKQIEGFYLRMETKEDPLPEVDEKVTIIERELLKLHQEVDRLKNENQLLREAKAQQETEYMRAVSGYKAQLDEKEGKLKACEEELRLKDENKSSGVQMLQHQLEQLQQTVLKKQLMLDALKSEKSSLEYRLADTLRDKARIESIRSVNANQNQGWCDPESGLTDEKVHYRPISRLLPDFVPGNVLSNIDSMDEVYTGFVQLMEKSPSLRVLVFVYLFCVHVGFLILFFKRK